VARAFAEKIGTTLPVLADYKHEVARAYGIFDEDRHWARRTTFTVDADGIIRGILQDREAMDVDPGLEICRLLEPVQSTR
jgi:alkyl hydroperoxide reductase subunit AhpC